MGVGGNARVAGYLRRKRAILRQWRKYRKTPTDRNIVISRGNRVVGSPA